MGMIRIFAFLVAILAVTSSVTEVLACPPNHVRCGGACCPGR